jgi:DNA-binding response OmpR family regulator
VAFILFATSKRLESLAAAEILRGHGHEVKVVDDGLQALEVILARAGAPVLLFAHVMLAELDGEELYYTLKKKHPECNLRMILGLVAPSNGEPWRKWDNQIDSYIMMPYSPWQLVFSVEQLIYRHIEMIAPEETPPLNTENSAEIQTK